MKIYFKEKEVRMLPVNPRFTDMKNINFKNMKFEEQYNQIEISKELVQYEGDLSDLYDLIKSIKKNGFNTINNKILVHVSGKNYYVLEGNRRFLALNLINENILFSDIVSKDQPYYKNIDISIFNSNINKINNILNKNSSIKIAISQEDFEDVSNKKEEEIWNLIYIKHVGEESGKRNWSRAKYFNDLLYRYINDNGEHDKKISLLSELFGRKKQNIEADLRSAIWVIRSIEMYNSSNSQEQIDLNNMEVSNFELVLGQTLYINQEQTNLRKILGISIDIKKGFWEYSSKYNSSEIKDIINFLIKESLSKNITTREIKDNIVEELSDLLSITVMKKNLYFYYNSLKTKKQEKTSLEKSQFEFLDILNKINDDIKKEEFKELPDDSKFVKSIKYIIRNDLKTLSNLRKMDNNEYPIFNISITIRTIIDLLLLEFIYQAKKWSASNFNETKEEKLKEVLIVFDTFIKNYKKSKKHKVNFIQGKFNEICTILSLTYDELIEKYIQCFVSGNKKLSIFINEEKGETFKNDLIFILRSQDPNNTPNMRSTLNEYVHKPYFAIEQFENKNSLNEINQLFSHLKSLLTKMQIWNKK